MTTRQHARQNAERQMMFVNLMWLFMLFMQPAFGSGRPWEWALALLAATGFTVFYLREYQRGDTRHVTVLATAAFVLSFFNTGASVFYVYAAFLLGTFRHGRALWRGLGALALLILVQALLLAFLYGSAFAGLPHLVSIVMLLLAGTTSNAEHERQAITEQLREANERISEVSKVAERERIARDMHDVLGHTLSVVVLKSELAGRLVAHDPARAGEEIRDVEQLARQALSDVRAAISGYRVRGFSGELAGVRTVLNAAGLELEEDIRTGEPAGPAARIFPFILREAATNILRHSGATHCRVALQAKDGELHLEVTDNGESGAVTEGYGIAGMRERLEQEGGRLEVEAGRNGFRLLAVLPPQREAVRT